MNQRYSKFYKNNRERQQNRQSKNARERKRRLAVVGIFGICFLVVLCAVIFSFRFFYDQVKEGIEEITTEDYTPEQVIGAAALFPDLPITEEFLTVNRYSRPGLALTASPQYIVIHYTANPGSTAEQNRNYFENLKDTEETFASAQFVIGLEGEIIQCVPCNEMAYCSNNLNEICISIEMCHPDDTGNFNDATYNNCVYLVAHLMNYYNLDMNHLIRHYDVTGKNCPKYFVEHEDRWEVFKGFVEEYREKFAGQEQGS
ncbi:MAG: peptidoglycan recognition protein family protein [Lachnospiraceae bacterium]|nr:peptidoglycan recognition protein family protein [Lachnospiraceae bacterium]